MIGFSLLDSANESNAAFLVAKLKPFEDRAGAAEFGAGADPAGCSAQAQQIRTANVVRLQPAADHRPVDQRRLRIPARGARGTGSGEPRQRHAGRRRRRQPGPAPGAGVLHLHRDQRRPSISTSTATRRRRSASTSTTSSPRCSRRSAASSSTTSTSTAAPGRSISRARRADRARHLATSGRSTCATRRARWCRCARSPTSASSPARR